MALAVLRLIGEEVRKERTTRVIAQLPVDVSTFLINEKREWLHQLESQRAIDIVLVPDPNMQTPNYSIRRMRDDETALPENAVPSHHIAGTGTVELDYQSQADKIPAAAPAAVQQIAPPSPAPPPAAAQLPLAALPEAGFWSRLKWLFTGSSVRDPGEAASPAQREDKPDGRPAREERGGRRPHRGDRGERPDRGPRRDRDRNRHRDRDRNRDGERHGSDRPREPRENRDNEPRPRDNEPRNRDHEPRNRGHAAETPRPPQPVQTPAPEQVGSEGEAQRRRRRRRGRGGRGGRDRQESYRPNDTQPIAAGGGDSGPHGEAAPPAAPDHLASQAPEPVRESMPAPPSPSPKSGETYTVWSSTPGEGEHFSPKD